jgi:hypothetical protein
MCQASRWPGAVEARRRGARAVRLTRLPWSGHIGALRDPPGVEAWGVPLCPPTVSLVVPLLLKPLVFLPVEEAVIIIVKLFDFELFGGHKTPAARSSLVHMPVKHSIPVPHIRDDKDFAYLIPHFLLPPRERREMLREGA